MYQEIAIFIIYLYRSISLVHIWFCEQFRSVIALKNDDSLNILQFYTRASRLKIEVLTVLCRAAINEEAKV